MYTFSQPATTQVAATTDYRYIGNNPNNYITFNNETWRIIGVFDGKIKIIRDERILNGNISWDYKKTGIGSSTTDYGSNDWVDSQLMYMLNDNDIATHVAKKTNYTFANGKPTPRELLSTLSEQVRMKVDLMLAEVDEYLEQWMDCVM